MQLSLQRSSKRPACLCAFPVHIQWYVIVFELTGRSNAQYTWFFAQFLPSSNTHTVLPLHTRQLYLDASGFSATQIHSNSRKGVQPSPSPFEDMHEIVPLAQMYLHLQACICSKQDLVACRWLVGISYRVVSGQDPIPAQSTAPNFLNHVHGAIYVCNDGMRPGDQPSHHLGKADKGDIGDHLPSAYLAALSTNCERQAARQQAAGTGLAVLLQSCFQCRSFTLKL